MTTLTLKLPSHIYERLRREADRRATSAQTLAETLLAERFDALDDVPVSYPPLAPEVQAMLAKMKPEELLPPPQGTREEARALLRSWREEPPEEDGDGESWDDVMRALDAHHESDRRLFPDLEPHP